MSKCPYGTCETDHDYLAGCVPYEREIPSYCPRRVGDPCPTCDSTEEK